MTHTLQILHSLQSHQPLKDERALRPKPLPWLAAPTLTRYLGWVLSMSQTPQHVSLTGLRGNECSGCVHSVDVEDVRLPSPLLADVQFVDFGEQRPF